MKRASALAAAILWSGAALAQFDIKADFGAAGDGVTDDHAAFEAARATMLSTGGTLFFPPGVYCNKTPTTFGHGHQIKGAERVASVISACGANVTPIKLNGPGAAISDIGVDGYDSPFAAYPALLLDTLCTECAVTRVQVKYGAPTIQTNVGNNTILDSKIIYGYGDYIYSPVGGLYIIRTQIDTPAMPCTPSPQSWPAPAWAASSAYAVCDLVVLSGAYLIQATGAGTSAASAPSPAVYGAPIADGTVTWQFVGPYGAYANGVHVTGGNNYIWGTDITGPFTRGVKIAGSGSIGTAITNSTIGSNIYASIYAQGGSSLLITGNFIPGCLYGYCAGIEIASGHHGDVSIVGNTIVNMFLGLNFSSGSNFQVSSNNLVANYTAIYAAGGIGGMSIVGNNFGPSQDWGGNNSAIWLDTGAGDYIVIMGNRCDPGANNGIHDAATGSHKYIVGNLGC